MKKMNKKGFTIVELVIVIAVIGILAAVLIPTFTIVIKKANQSAAMQGLDTARKEYLTIANAADDDYAEIDANTYYYYTVDKKGTDYDHLKGIWQYKNGEFTQVVSNATTGYSALSLASEKVAPAAYAKTTYYKIDGTAVTFATDDDIADYKEDDGSDLYAKYDAVEIQGIAVYKKN